MSLDHFLPVRFRLFLGVVFLQFAFTFLGNNSSCASKYRSSLRMSSRIIGAKCEEFKQIIGFKKTSLLRVLQHSIAQKLLEYLPARNVYIRFSTMCFVYKCC